jgi:hypothetical protein
MPYTSISTVSDGQVLTASHLNTLSANQAFLYGLANQANIPFNTFRIATASGMSSTDAVWYIKHRLQHFHFKVSCNVTTPDWDYVRIFYNGVKVASNEAPGSTSFGQYWSTTSWASIPNDLGAWATSTAYDDNTAGDGDVVSNDGEYYKCSDSHTSGASTEPGVGASWETVWDLLTLPALGSMCTLWVTAGVGGGTRTLTVEYMIESDATSL